MARPPQTLGRTPGKLRDARLFVVATEDTYAPRQYFGFFDHDRLIVRVLHTEGGESSPLAVVARLKTFQDDYQLGDDDQLWALLDTDHWIEDSHKRGLVDAIRQAKQQEFRVAMSNPCFDLWLLLHHTEVPPGSVFPNCQAVGIEIRRLLGEFNKCNLKGEHYSSERVRLAMNQARALDKTHPSADPDFWPESTGSRVYLLLDELEKAGLLRMTS